MIFSFTNFSLIQKVWSKMSSVPQKLTTQYTLCLMDADAKRPGEGDQKLAKSCKHLLWKPLYIGV